MLKLLYFFNLVDIMGCAQEELVQPAEVDNVAKLLVHLGQCDEKYRSALADGSKLQITINKKFVDNTAMIRDGDEIAFFPNSR